MITIIKILLNSFGVKSINQLSVYGYRIAYGAISFKICLCLLLDCDFKSNIVSGQKTAFNERFLALNDFPIADTCSMPVTQPLQDKLELSVTEEPGTLRLNYKCKDDYTLVGESENVCLKGKWFLPQSYQPKCIKLCSQLPFSDITIDKCELDGEKMSCLGLIQPNTIARVYCSFGYRQPNVGFVDVIRCGENGEWDLSMSRCEQICGLEEYEGLPPTSNTIVAWHVGIFSNIENIINFYHKCGGTILSAKIVISAAHCFVRTIDISWYDPTEFKVVAGHHSRYFYPSSENFTTQILNVARIVHNNYKGYNGKFASDLSLLVLVENIIFTPTIQPACLEVDYDSTQTTVASGLTAQMAAWDTKNDLLKTDMTSSGRDKCIDKFDSAPEKFCVISKNSDFCKFTEGTGLVLPKKIGEKTIYFLRGVAAADGECTVDTKFTDIQFHILIISEQLNQINDRIDTFMKMNESFQTLPVEQSYSLPVEQSSSLPVEQSSSLAPVEESSAVEGSCMISYDLPETIQVYYAAQPDLEITKGSYIDSFVNVIYKCKAKQAIVGRNATNFCLNGEWNIPDHPKCIKLCSPKNLSGVTTSAICEIDGETISCHQPLRPNTIAHLTCAIGYRRSTDHFYDVLRCGDDGEWDYQPFKCEPICGIEAPDAVPYIIGGDLSNITKVPWHVGIFSDINNKGRFNQICGGTILNAKVVVSAAHCFWNNRDDQFYNESNFKVAVGKYYRDFYATEPIKSQILNVTHIHTKAEYSDYAGLYAFDIVLLIVEDYIVFKSYIKPICLETLFYNEKNVAPGSIGRVAGWGLESSGGKSSAVLKIIDLPAIEYHECKEKFSPEFRPFITPDKFCAGFTDGRSVCEGDSGGGLAIPKMIGGTSVYYLRGIVSTGNNKAGSCDNEKYTVFTNIQYHIDMITYIESVNRPR